VIRSVPSLSVVIPVLNAERDLPACLESIQRQTCRERMDVVVVDGGSIDATAEIARAAGARVVPNPLRKAEPGVAIGMRAASAPLITVMAADNRMVGEDFVATLLRTFQDPDVVAAFPRVVSPPGDRLVNRYFNRYSDPFNHFVYGSWYTSMDVVLRRAGDPQQLPIRPTVRDHPLLAVAQGCTVRAGSVYREAPEAADDVLAIVRLIETGGSIVLLGGVRLEHGHVTGLGSVYRKYRNRSREALGAEQGYLRRETYLSRGRRLRKLLWIPYSATLVPVVVHAAVMAIHRRDTLLLYHPIVNTVLFAAVMAGVGPSVLAGAAGRAPARS
jgi:glycosyltransferase involved in cell wall biosynthesis